MDRGDTESWDMYCPGGFHPIHLGDTLNKGRYAVAEKLGSGGFATVWLCRDLIERKWKAVKVVAASVSDSTYCSDLKVAEYLDDLTPEELEEKHICVPEGYFYERGPNGLHLCLVLPLLGISLDQFWHKFSSHPHVLMHVCAQMVEAMEFLHSRGICHGDFRPSNILLQLQGVDELSPKEMRALLIPSIPLRASPESENSPHVPDCIYIPTTFHPGNGYMSADIMVNDFGQAYHVGHPPEDNGIPLRYAAPEVCFPIKSVELGFATDIWALGATLSEIRHGRMPFFLCSHDQHDYCKRIEEVLGPLPEPYRSLMRDHDKVWHEGAQYNPIDQPISWTPEEWLKKQDLRLRRFGHTDALASQIMEPDDFEEAPPPDALHLLDLLRKIFKYNPHDRLTIAQVKAHPWFRDYFPEAKEASVKKDVTALDGHGYGSSMPRYVSAEGGATEVEDTFMDHDFVAVAGNMVEDTALEEGAVARDPPENQPRHTALSRLHETAATYSEEIALLVLSSVVHWTIMSYLGPIYCKQGV